MATKPTTPAATPSADQSQPAPGLASKLAAKLAGKAKGTEQPAADAIPSRAGTKGGRLSVADESAEFLRKNGLVAVPADSAGSAGLAPAQPVYVVTPEFVGEVTEKVLKAIESWDVSSATHEARALVGNEALAKEYGQSCAAPAGCIQTISESMKEVARKYPNIVQWAPELAILGAGGAWIAKRTESRNALKKIRHEMNKQLEAMTAYKTPNAPRYAGDAAAKRNAADAASPPPIPPGPVSGDNARP